MKLSVITINRNNKEGLNKTIKSVLSQTFDDYEYLVIDGGSTDGSTDIISAYSDKITYWVSEPDKGIYNAMNKAINRAEGEYCYFLNSGDLLASEDVFKDIFRENSHASFICGNFIWDKKGSLIRDESYKNRNWIFSLYDIYSGFLNHQAFFIQKEMFNKYGLYDERFRIMSDWKLFFVAIGLYHETVEYKDVDIAIYDTEGFSSTIGGKAILAEKKAIAKEILSAEVFAKIDKLYYLERNDFMIDFIHSQKWIHFIFKALLKTCEKLHLYKV